MKKSTKFFLVDSALIGLMGMSGLSGLLLWFVFPRGAGQGEIRWFLKDIHKWSGLGLTAVAAYHLIIHWDWFKSTGSRLVGKRKPNHFQK